MMSLKRHGILPSDSRQAGKVHRNHFAWKGDTRDLISTLGNFRICSPRTSLGSCIPQNKQEHPIHICSLFFHLKSERHKCLLSLCHSTKHRGWPLIFSVLVAVRSSVTCLAFATLQKNLDIKSRKKLYVYNMNFYSRETSIKYRSLQLVEMYSVLSTKTHFMSLFFSRANRVHLYRVWVGLLHTILYDKETDTFSLNRLIIHENYNASTYENDIALLELKGFGKGECSLQQTTPACIPWSEYMFKAGDRCKVSGWGLEKGICFSAYYKNVLFVSLAF